jgi:hypothetical protein
VADRIDLAEVYQMLVGVSKDAEESLDYIDRGRKLAVARGASPANWYLMELQVRLSRSEADECNRLTKLLATRYGQEPGVAEALYQVLVRFGVITPDGKVAGLPQDSEAVGVGLDSPPGAGDAEPSGLWTPDSGAQKQASKLWLPGMQ